jgi:heme/copper-type cytochrome/quinol oxidase subunit 1
MSMSIGIYPDAFSDWNFISSLGAYVFAAGMLVFFANMIFAFVRKAPASANPWGQGATTLEWTLPSPPPFHQFDTLPRVVGPSLDSSSLENPSPNVESPSESPSREPRPAPDYHGHRR